MHISLQMECVSSDGLFHSLLSFKALTFGIHKTSQHSIDHGSVLKKNLSILTEI